MASSKSSGRGSAADLGRLWLLAALAITILSLAACGGGGSSDATTTDPVVRVEIDAASVLLTGAGQERQIAARAVTAGGNVSGARVSWSSSNPSQVGVDDNGKLRSVTPIGSAQVFAEVDGVRSAPVLVSTVELRPGTLLLRDADVVAVAAPAAPATGGFPGPGTQYDIWLAGPQAPAVGTIVLATETANVAGRVVETAAETGRTRVRLEHLAVPDLLARYDVNWVIDLVPYELVIDTPTSTSREQSLRARERALAGGLPEWKIPAAGTQSPCSASVEAKFKAKPLQVKFAGAPKLEAFSSRLDDTLPPGRLRVALVGDFYIETSVGLTAEAGLEGEAKCELKAHIPLPFLPVPFNWLLKVPVGIGVAASGKVEIASIDIGLSGKNGAVFEMGIDCAPPQPCRGLDKAERINEFKPHLEVASAQTEGLRIELEAGAYFLTGIDAVFGIGNASYQFNLIDVKVGPKQKADFGSVKRQLDVVPYASDYDLAFVLELGPGSSVKKAIEQLIGEEPAELSFGIKASLPVSESPRGAWRPDKTSVVPNRDTVRLDIDLTDFSKAYWKLGYNVERIEIYRKHETEMEFALLRTLSAAESQVHFDTTWEPTPADAGRNDFAVFALSKLPVVRLEIATMQSIQVGCFGGAATGASRQLALGAAAATCADTWSGPSTYVVHTPGLAGNDITARANLTWLVDSARSGSGVIYYKASGSFDVAFTSTGGCTFALSPSRFTVVEDPLMLSLLTISQLGSGPQRYSFSASQRVTFTSTATCPGRDPVVTEFRDFLVAYAIGDGPFDASVTTLAGQFDDGAVGSTWSFSRP